MSDYGLKVSKVGASVIRSNDLADLLLTSRYPLAKLDTTLDTSFVTIAITFLSTPTPGVETQVYSFAHGYTYTPRVWGLWNMEPTAAMTWMQYKQYYGAYVTAATGFGSPNMSARYEVSDTTVTLYVTASNGTPDPVDITGLVAKLTLYIFVEDISAEDYTVDT